MELKNWLEEYARLNELPAPRFHEGIFQLVIHKSLVVTFEPSQDETSFYAYSGLGEIRQYEEKLIFEGLLRGNLFGGETGRASFGLIPNTKILIFFEHFSFKDWTIESFAHELDLFTRYLFYWIEKVETLKSKNGDSLSNLSQLRGLEGSGKMKIFFA